MISAEVVRQRGMREALEPALVALRARVNNIYLHIDMDVLDPGEAPANEFAPPGGLTTDQVEEVIRTTAAPFMIRAAALTAYDPAYDQADRTYRPGVRLMDAIASTTRC